MSELLLEPETTDASIPDALPRVQSVLGQADHENFPVASRLLPQAVRTHLLAVYGFARLADDIGDEAEGHRLELLDWLDAELDRAFDGAATHPLLAALTPTIRQFDLPADPFRRLIEANRRDQVVRRYQTFDDLRAYCMLSAAPVGELVLRIFEVSSPARIALSDDVCTALQVIEHLQDVGEDAARDRIYLPRHDLRLLGCPEGDLSAPRTTAALRAVLHYEAGRARRLLGSAAPLAGQLPLQARIAVCGFAAGGLAALDSIEAADFEVLGHRCRPRPVRVLGHAVSTVRAASRVRAR
jgi:squalene synthase HpnC